MNIVATPATRTIAKAILADAQWDGGDAVLRHLPDVRPDQLAALIHLLVRTAITGEVPAATGAHRKPLTLSVDERRRAHRRQPA